MKIPLWLLVILGLALGGLYLWGAAIQRHASKQELALQAALESRDSAVAFWHLERSGLIEAVRGLRADSAALTRATFVAQLHASQARRRADSLLSRIVDTMVSNAVRLGFQSDSVQLAGCVNLLTNCEARAQNAEARAHGDSVQLAATSLLLTQTGDAWQRALHPNIFQQYYRSRAVTIPLTLLVILQAIRH